MEPANTNTQPLRVVLVDFDWTDADLIPELLRQSSFDVRLVAGEKAEEAGVRVAELCGVPRSIDLADLTREIFDLALVGERSPRRAQIERLLNALGTPVKTPTAFLNGTGEAANEPAHDQAGHGNGSSGDRIDGVLAEAIPDIASPVPPGEWSNMSAAGSASDTSAAISDAPPAQAGAPAVMPAEHPQLGLIAASSDVEAVRDMLERWLEATSGLAAELHMRHPDQAVKPIGTGVADPMLGAIARLACDARNPQAISMMAGSHRGKVWGAWPIRVGEAEGALAAGGLDDAEGRAYWEEAARVLSEQWSDPAGTPASGAHPSHGWLEPSDYMNHLEAVVERNREDGVRFDLHRLRFNGPQACVDIFCRALPEQLRASDVICRPAPNQIVLLCTGPLGSFAFVRRRLMTSWEEAWQQAGPPSPPPPIVDDRVEMVDPQDAAGFLSIARDWLNGR